MTAKYLSINILRVTLLAYLTVLMEGKSRYIYPSSFFFTPRFVLKGAAYNPMDVMNCLMIRRGYKMQGLPQQRTLPNIHNKDDK